MHVQHLAATGAQHLYHYTDRLRVGFDMHFFKRLEGFAVFGLLEDHLRARDLELIAFPAHGFNQDRQVQLTATGNHEGVGAIRLSHPQCHVLAQFVEQALTQLA